MDDFPASRVVCGGAKRKQGCAVANAERTESRAAQRQTWSEVDKQAKCNSASLIQETLYVA
jgi:hypothetical protein